MEYQEDALAAALVEALKAKGWTVTFAESCTAGLAAGRLVNYPGASEVLNMGFVTYSNEAKIELIGVKPDTLERYGAVSEETVGEMARGACARAKAETAIAITGLAGPGGGTPELPTGTMWIGIVCDGRVVTKRLQLQDERNENRSRAVEEALRLLLSLL